MSIQSGCLLPFLFVVVSLAAIPAASQSAELAATPPMGWNSWNHFAAKVTDADIRATADAMVSSGMKDAGYIYVNIDDSWAGGRDTDGTIRPNDKFPDMKALANYVHSKGLKLGIYTSPGPRTCTDYVGSNGHEEQDAKTFAEWGIDYLKYDLCSFDDLGDVHLYQEKPSMGKSTESRLQGLQLQKQAYEKMHKALLATGRPIVFSLCQYGVGNVWEWGVSVGGNLWRTTDDITDTYDRMSVIGFGQAGLAKYAGPGHWNDPDMLEVGNGGMNEDEYRTHMTLWVILAAPLLAGNDLSKMSAETLAMLTNKEVIAVDQDPLGIQGDRVSAVGPLEIWSKPLAGGSKAVALFNRGESSVPMTLDLPTIGFTQTSQIRDLWAGKETRSENGKVILWVRAHGAALLRVSR
ncbi:MAG: glycoside hydrolase family 27 protein [Terriglobales bacterium]